MLVTGTVNTVLTKILFGITTSAGCCGWTSEGVDNTQQHYFQHPWFQTSIMFFGEFLCFLPFLYVAFYKDKPKESFPIGINTTGTPSKSEKTNYYTYIFAFPTICDLTSTTLMNVALLWVPASFWQMMRGVIIIFSGILSIFILKRKLRLHNWLGMSIVVAGLVLVGGSGFRNTSNSSASLLVIIGIGLILFAQLLSATQVVVEEVLLKKQSYHPLNIVFMEGFWGIIFMYTLIIPIANITPQPKVQNPYTNHTTDPLSQIYHENFIDALMQMYNKPLFIVLEICILLSMAFFNFFGLTVTSKLTAVHRTLIDACRTIFVWGTQVILKIIDPVMFVNVGEDLSVYSLLQLGGFVLLIIGTLIYNEVIHIPCSVYNNKKEDM